MTEVKENQKFWYGDFYPLTRAGPGWMPSPPGSSIVPISAPASCWRFAAASVPTSAAGRFACAEADAQYKVEIIDEVRARQEQTVPGRELLSDFELRLRKKARACSSATIHYE